jgi:hypothetical protein
LKKERSSGTSANPWLVDVGKVSGKGFMVLMLKSDMLYGVSPVLGIRSKPVSFDQKAAEASKACAT